MKKKQFRKSVFIALVSLLVALFSASTATFAWYIYNTSSHTTNVKMAAGAGLNLQISNNYNGPYSSYTSIDENIVGILLPVSTDVIDNGNGFQAVASFTEPDAQHSYGLAKYFSSANETYYYKVPLFLKTTGNTAAVYLANIGFTDSDENNPISTAIRVGLVIHEPGENQPIVEEQIYEINKAKNPQKDYNTFNGYEGCVLDHTKTDGSVIDFSSSLLSQENYCNYNSATAEFSLKPQSKKLCNLHVDSVTHESLPVQVDVYIWLEGCDEDCTANLMGKTLQNISLSFAAMEE